MFQRHDMQIRRDSALRIASKILRACDSRPVLTWILVAMPAIFLFLHTSHIAPLAWELRALEGATKEKGFAYSIEIPTQWMSKSVMKNSPARVLENGNPLVMPNSRARDVAKMGNGRVSFGSDRIYLSSSDNSDLRTNGRRYELHWPAPVNRIWSWGANALAFAVFLILAVRHRTQLVAFIEKRELAIAMGVFIVPFSVSRLWFFLDFPLPMVTPDSALYSQLATEITSGEWPLFGKRQPGYPLLVWLFGSDGLTPLLAVQNLLTLLGSLCVIFGVHRLKPRLSIGAAAAMAGFACSGASFEMDGALLSDPVYSNCVVLSLALLFCAWGTRRTVFYALSSSAIAATILVRPDGLYLIVIYLLVAIFMIRNRFGAARCFSFFIPTPALLLLLCSYNYFTLDIFTISPWGDVNLAAATHSFWQTDERFSPSVNSDIEIAQAKVDPKDREILKTSWDMKELNAVFYRNYDWKLGDLTMTHRRKNYVGWHVLREVSLVAIEKQPILYAKFVLSNLWRFYFLNIGADPDPRGSMQIRASRIFVKKSFMTAAMREEYKDSSPPAGSGLFLHKDSSGVWTVITPTRMQRAYFWLNDIRRPFFNRPIWNVGLLLIFTASLIVLMRSRLTHDGAFLLLVLTSTAIGASLVVSLVEIALVRYSYATLFTSYLSVMLVPLLFVPAVHPERPRS